MRRARQVLYFLLLVTLAIAAYLPLVDKEFRWSFEPGAEGNLVVTKQFYWFFGYPGKATLPRKMDVTQTYFSAPYIFTAASAHVINFLSKQGILLGSLTSNDDSLFIFSFRYTNVLFYALAVGLAYLCLVNILRIRWLSFLLTLSAFLLNHVTLKIDLMRVDFYLLFSSVLFFYAAFRLIDNPSSKINYALFGLAFILSASTKLNTPLYLNIPAIIAVLFLIRKNIDLKNLLILLGAMAVSSVIFFIEWYLYPGSILPFITDVYAEGKLWLSIAPSKPYSFYHFDCFFSHSLSMGSVPSILRNGFFQSVISKSLLISLLSVYGAFAFLAFRVWLSVQPKLILLIAIFIIHSAGLILGPKFIHYAYLMPFYFLMLTGFALAELNRLKWRRIFWGAAIVWILFPMIFYGCNYIYTLQQFECSRRAFETVKMKPREWILNHVKPGSKIATHGGTADIPPLSDGNFDFSPDFMKIPWNKPDEMMNKVPPEKKELQQMTDIILLSNYSYELWPQLLKNLVEAKYDVSDDSVKFNQFLLHLEQMFPGIISGFSQGSNKPLSRESFMKTLLSYMWAEPLTFREALAQYSCNTIGDDNFSEKLIELAENDLFSSNKTVLNAGYTDFIQQTGGMMFVYAWKQFYDDANAFFKSSRFESPYEYYEVNWQNIIVVNEGCLI